MTAPFVQSAWAYYATVGAAASAYNYVIPKGNPEHVVVAIENFIAKQKHLVKNIRLWSIDKFDGNYRSVQLTNDDLAKEKYGLAVAIYEYLSNSSIELEQSKVLEIPDQKIVLQVYEATYQPLDLGSIIPNGWLSVK